MPSLSAVVMPFLRWTTGAAPAPVAACAAPIEFHVWRDLDGHWVVARQSRTMGQYFTEASARELACWCAVMEAAQGQPAQVHAQEGAEWHPIFVTTDHTPADAG